MDLANFGEQSRRGLFDARREAPAMMSGGVGPDCRVYPAIPERTYLKTIFCALD